MGAAVGVLACVAGGLARAEGVAQVAPAPASTAVVRAAEAVVGEVSHHGADEDGVLDAGHVCGAPERVVVGGGAAGGLFDGTWVRDGSSQGAPKYRRVDKVTVGGKEVAVSLFRKHFPTSKEAQQEWRADSDTRGEVFYVNRWTGETMFMVPGELSDRWFWVVGASPDAKDQSQLLARAEEGEADARSDGAELPLSRWGRPWRVRADLHSSVKGSPRWSDMEEDQWGSGSLSVVGQVAGAAAPHAPASVKVAFPCTFTHKGTGKALQEAVEGVYKRADGDPSGLLVYCRGGKTPTTLYRVDDGPRWRLVQGSGVGGALIAEVDGDWNSPAHDPCALTTADAAGSDARGMPLWKFKSVDGHDVWGAEWTLPLTISVQSLGKAPP